MICQLPSQHFGDFEGLKWIVPMGRVQGNMLLSILAYSSKKKPYKLRPCMPIPELFCTCVCVWVCLCVCVCECVRVLN